MRKTHGTRTTYIAGCRCEQCRSANNSYMAQYRRERLDNSKPAWRNNRQWEPWEDDVASDYTMNTCQIADMLERTPAAVASRRKYLKAHRNKQKARAHTTAGTTTNRKEAQK